MDLIVGETLHDEDRTLFIVEAKWPNSPAWGRYSPSAFNDVRNPSIETFFGIGMGTFDRNNMDVANAPSRVGAAPFNRDWFVGPFESPPQFTNLLDASAYGQRLAEFGECSARYGDGGTQESRDALYAGKKVAVRIVRERLLRKTETILGLRVVA